VGNSMKLYDMGLALFLFCGLSIALGALYQERCDRVQELKQELEQCDVHRRAVGMDGDNV